MLWNKCHNYTPDSDRSIFIFLIPIAPVAPVAQHFKIKTEISSWADLVKTAGGVLLTLGCSSVGPQ